MAWASAGCVAAAQLAATRPEAPPNPFLLLQAASEGTRVEKSDKWSCANVFGE